MLVKGNSDLIKGIRNILLIQLGDIGDVVLSFPAIRALRENFPQANVIVAVMEKAGELIDCCPWASGVITINKNKRRLSRKIAYQKNFFSCLRKYNFDLAIDLRTGQRGATLAFLSGARQRIGFYAYDGKLWRNRVFTNLALLKGKPGQHMAEYYLKLLTTYNITTENIWPELQIPWGKQKNAAELLKKENIPTERPLVAIQPFSQWQYKEWGIDKYIRLINWIGAEYKMPVIITGSPDERKRAEKIIKDCKQRVFNLAGKTSIGIFAAVLKTSVLFIGGDSSGMHIAAAAGTPTVSIFGPASSAAWAPRGKGHMAVYKDLPCLPCNQKGCQGGGISRCLEELTVEEVMPAVKDQINGI